MQRNFFQMSEIELQERGNLPLKNVNGRLWHVAMLTVFIFL
ncbi:Uncharacterised protein [Salmonella enterica]|uniref:Uncharacterized protein n=1 Tax=Salmonella enterica TaxID=28901 RepID=A0A379QD59_SALER|nr:Uncharacterised protein [Salmonella enterica]